MPGCSWLSMCAGRGTRLAWLLMLTGPASAALAQTATIGITASVAEACQSSVDNGSASADFGTLDFGEYGSLDSTIDGSSSEQAGSIGITCVSGQSYTILLDGGGSGDTSARQMTGISNGAQISYNLYTNAERSTIWDDSTGVSASGNGRAQWYTVYARVPAQTTPVADVYTDTVNVTVGW